MLGSDDETEELGQGAGVCRFDALQPLHADHLQQIPFVEQFDKEKRNLAGIVMKLKNKWPCKKELSGHDSCIDARGEHIQLTMPRLRDWAKCIVSFVVPFCS